MGAGPHERGGPAAARLGPVSDLLALRRGLLLAAAAPLLVGVASGLSRIGVPFPGAERWVPQHGPLLVVGAFTSLVALERAVALGGALGYLAPALGVGASVGLALGAPWAPVCGAAAAFALFATNVALVQRQDTAFTRLMAVGALLLLGADVLLARGLSVPQVAPAWMGFFVLTITAERLEMSRLAPVPKAALLLVPLASAVLAVSTAAAPWEDAASRVAGASLIALGAWLLAFDLARRTVRGVGLPRFSATAVLAGAAWLVVAGALLATGGLPPAGPRYDAVLHAVFVGFVLSMVFAHAPIVLPAVARVAVPFHRSMYAPLALLHAGMTARLAGDLAGADALRRGGAAGTGLALAAFVVVAVFSALRRRASPPSGARRS